MDLQQTSIAETLFGASTVGRSPGADDGRPERGKYDYKNTTRKISN